MYYFVDPENQFHLLDGDRMATLSKLLSKSFYFITFSFAQFIIKVVVLHFLNEHDHISLI